MKSIFTKSWVRNVVLQQWWKYGEQLRYGTVFEDLLNDLSKEAIFTKNNHILTKFSACVFHEFTE